MLRPVLIWSAVAAFAADQVSKYIVVHTMELARVRAIDVWPPLLNFRYGENTGINFGLLSGRPDAMRWILIGFAVAVVVALLLWVRRTAPDWRIQASAGLLIGGALANVLDRLIYGYVLDFLNMSCCGINNPFVFNIADVFIFSGALGLVLWSGDGEGKKPA